MGIFRKEETSQKTNSQSVESVPAKILSQTPPQGSVSATSIESIQLKREAAKIRESKGDRLQGNLFEAYSAEDFTRVWQSMLGILDKRGEHLLLTNLGRTTPTIENDTIQIIAASQLAKIEIEAQQERLLIYLRKQLRNYAITFHIEVTEQVHTAVYYTPEEKFQALQELNPYLETFVRELGLDF